MFKNLVRLFNPTLYTISPKKFLSDLIAYPLFCFFAIFRNLGLILLPMIFLTILLIWAVKSTNEDIASLLWILVGCVLSLLITFIHVETYQKYKAIYKYGELYNQTVYEAVDFCDEYCKFITFFSNINYEGGKAEEIESTLKCLKHQDFNIPNIRKFEAKFIMVRVKIKGVLDRLQDLPEEFDIKAYHYDFKSIKDNIDRVDFYIKEIIKHNFDILKFFRYKKEKFLYDQLKINVKLLNEALYELFVKIKTIRGF